MVPIISTVELLKLASGDIVSLQVYKFIGAQRGKKVYIQANLHGSEIVGNAVIQQLIEYLSSLEPNQIRGEIWLVPVCNPLGINQRHHVFSTGRFSSYDGKNWNRIFWDYEKECLDLTEFARSQLDYEPKIIRKNYLEKISFAWQQQLEQINQPRSIPLTEQYRYRLQSLCLDADYVIDIHSSSNQGLDYLFCFQGREESAKYLLFEYGILMNEYEGEAFDEAFLKPWLALERELANLGKVINFDLESWTLELGTGMQIHHQSVVRGVEGIKNYLSYKKVLPGVAELQTESIKLVNKNKLISYHAPTGGMIQKRVALGTKVRAGERLYQLLSFNKQEKLPEVINIQAETDGLVFDLSTNQSVNQGEYVLDILNY